jgi:hypothetical protein
LRVLQQYKKKVRPIIMHAKSDKNGPEINKNGKIITNSLLNLKTLLYMTIQ